MKKEYQIFDISVPISPEITLKSMNNVCTDYDSVKSSGAIIIDEICIYGFLQDYEQSKKCEQYLKRWRFIKKSIHELENENANYRKYIGIFQNIIKIENNKMECYLGYDQSKLYSSNDMKEYERNIKDTDLNDKSICFILYNEIPIEKLGLIECDGYVFTNIEGARYNLLSGRMKNDGQAQAVYVIRKAIEALRHGGEPHPSAAPSGFEF